MADAGSILRGARPVLVRLLGEAAVAAAEGALVCPTCGRGW